MTNTGKFVYESEQLLLDQLRKEIGFARGPAWAYLLERVMALSLRIVRKTYGISGYLARQEAEDLTQTVIMDFFEMLQDDEDLLPEQRFQLSGGASVEGYLYICCFYQWGKTLRKAVKAPMTGARADAFLVVGEDMPAGEGDDPFLSLVRKDLAGWMEKAMKRLTQDQRQILRYFLADMQLADIQAQMGLSSTNVTSVKLNRAKTDLLDKVKKMLGMNENKP